MREGKALRGITLAEIAAHFVREKESTWRLFTAQIYRRYLHNHILPKWGGYPIEGIEATFVQTWLRQLRLSPVTKLRIRLIMQAIFQYAMRRKLLTAYDNPVCSTEIGQREERKSARVLSLDELRRLLNELGTQPFRLMVTLAACLGLRVGEVAALKWVDFDFERSQLTIRRAISGSHIEESRRTDILVLNQHLADMCLAWRSQSTFTQDKDWVFPDWKSQGTLPINPARITLLLQGAATKAGLGPGIRFGCLRRTYLETLLSLGTGLESVQRLLRHSSLATTLKLITCPDSEDLRAANSKFVRLLLEAHKPEKRVLKNEEHSKRGRNRKQRNRRDKCYKS